MHVVKRSEDVNAGDDDYDDVVEDVDDAMYADANELCSVSSTADIGGRL